MSEVVWRPSSEYAERANVTRFMRTHGIDTYEDLVQRSQDDVEWFWDAVVKDLGIEFFQRLGRHRYKVERSTAWPGSCRSCASAIARTS
jgi:acetyl-CoA synthetase